MQNDQNAADRIVQRNVNQQRLTRRLAISQTISLGVIAALVGDRIWLGHHPPAPKIILTDAHGNQVEATPLDEPVMSDADLVNWVARAAVAPYNFDYIHYRDTFSRNVKPYFTINGWNGVMNNLKASKNFDEVVKDSMVVEGVGRRPPSLVDSSVVDGVANWTYEVPILVSFRNTNVTREQRITAKLVVTRTSPTFHPQGIAVDSYNALVTG